MTCALIGNDVGGAVPFSSQRDGLRRQREHHLVTAHFTVTGAKTGTGSSNVPGKGWATRRFIVQ